MLMSVQANDFIVTKWQLKFLNVKIMIHNLSM